MRPTASTDSRHAATPGGWRAVGATPSRFGPGPRASRGGFTLTELLIVIGLIVLVIALAVPAFNAMTGGRSVDAAMNQLSAMLGRARMQAIGLQEPHGLLFYRDPATERVAARLVRTGTASNSAVLPLELVDADPMFLPTGVGMQTVDDFSGASSDDRYLGFNRWRAGDGTRPAVGGVILFDASGRLTSRPYGYTMWVQAPPPATGNVASMMARFLYGTTASPPTGGPQVLAPSTVSVIRSQFGFVLYDQEPMSNQFGTADDPNADKDPQLGGPSPREKEEETWLDQNALPVLINRYNGTLVRGE